MKCPICRSSDTEVYNSRSTKFGNQVWRRRRCLSCRKTFTTYEAPDLGFMKIEDGARLVSFSRARLYTSISEAFAGSRARGSVVNAITDTIETKLLDTKRQAFTREEIARTVLTTLKPYDKKAFLRYLADHAELTSQSDLKRQLKQY
jgi:transcriptional repressor NrdR